VGTSERRWLDWSSASEQSIIVIASASRRDRPAGRADAGPGGRQRAGERHQENIDGIEVVALDAHGAHVGTSERRWLGWSSASEQSIVVIAQRLTFRPGLVSTETRANRSLRTHICALHDRLATAVTWRARPSAPVWPNPCHTGRPTRTSSSGGSYTTRCGM